MHMEANTKMRARLSAFLLFALTLNVVPASLGQTQTGATPPPRQRDEDEVVTVGSAEVVLDALVKDKRGRPVKNLKAEDFEVYEDGVRQDVTSFRLVSRAVDTVTQPGAPAAPAATPRPNAERVPPSLGIGAVALVFDRLSPDSRARARDAAQKYLETGLGPGDFVGVFVINQSLQVVQPYTNDVQLARRAVEDAGSRGTSPSASAADAVNSAAARQQSLSNAADATESTMAGGAAGPAGAGAMADAAAQMGATATEQALNDMTARSLETFERIERDQMGYATTNGLLALVNSMRRVQGRKSIIFFSEGIAIPPDVQEQFKSVISNANRANVSIYAVDAAGLRTSSPNELARREMMQRGGRRLNQVASGRDDTSGPMMRGMERNEDLLTLNPDSGLGRLANETGGRLIADTNDIAPRLREAAEDMHSYYVLSYVPKNRALDGRFRTISVKLANHSDFEVQTRKGYFAIEMTDGSPTMAYEAPALAALGRGGQAAAFPLRAAAYNFPAAGRADLTSLVVQVPPGAVTYAADNDKKTFRTDFSVVVLVKDAAQRVVRKFSNQYLLGGPLAQLEAARRGEIIFYREAELPPGRYTVAVAAYDALTGQASVRSEEVEVQAGDPGRLRLSSLAVLKRAEQLKPLEQKPNTPFVVGDLLVYPNVGEPLSKAKDKQLAFYFTAYPAAGSQAPLKATVEIRQGAQTVGRVALELPAPDANGRVQFANALPIEQLKPGTYELKITVTDGKTQSARSEPFAVQP
jgi:VWFA-related protein